MRAFAPILILSSVSAAPALDVFVFRLITGGSDVIAVVPSVMSAAIALALPLALSTVAVRLRSRAWLGAVCALLTWGALYPFSQVPPHARLTDVTSPLLLFASAVSLLGAILALAVTAKPSLLASAAPTPSSP